MMDNEKTNRHPRCPSCGVPMWLVKIEVVDGESMHEFECKAYDAKAVHPASEQRV